MIFTAIPTRKSRLKGSFFSKMPVIGFDFINCLCTSYQENS